MTTWASRRKLGGIGWNVWRTFIGIAYLAAASFNTTYTLSHTSELDGYAEGAWFAFLTDFMRDVFIPNATVFMVLVIVFEIAVGLLIMSRGTWVDIGVWASIGWVLVAVLPFLAWPYLLTNLVLAVMQGAILIRRYDAAIWNLARYALTSRKASPSSRAPRTR